MINKDTEKKEKVSSFSYKVVLVSEGRDLSDQELETLLNKEGAEGWETSHFYQRIDMEVMRRSMGLTTPVQKFIVFKRRSV